jgi:hypothetical protein
MFIYDRSKAMSTINEDLNVELGFCRSCSI